MWSVGPGCPGIADDNLGGRSITHARLTKEESIYVGKVVSKPCARWMQCNKEPVAQPLRSKNETIGTGRLVLFYPTLCHQEDHCTAITILQVEYQFINGIIKLLWWEHASSWKMSHSLSCDPHTLHQLPLCKLTPPSSVILRQFVAVRSNSNKRASGSLDFADTCWCPRQADFL